MAIDITQRYIKEKRKVQPEISDEPIITVVKKDNLYIETPTKDLFHKAFSILFGLDYTYRKVKKHEDSLFESNKEFSYVIGRENGEIDFGYTGSKFFTNDILKKQTYKEINLSNFVGQYDISNDDLSQIEKSILEIEFKKIEEFEKKKIEEILLMEMELDKYKTYKIMFEKNDRTDLFDMVNRQITTIERKITAMKSRKLRKNNINTAANYLFDEDIILATQENKISKMGKKSRKIKNKIDN